MRAVASAGTSTACCGRFPKNASGRSGPSPHGIAPSRTAPSRTWVLRVSASSLKVLGGQLRPLSLTRTHLCEEVGRRSRRESERRSVYPKAALREQVGLLGHRNMAGETFILRQDQLKSSNLLTDVKGTSPRAWSEERMQYPDGFCQHDQARDNDEDLHRASLHGEG